MTKYRSDLYFILHAILGVIAGYSAGIILYGALFVFVVGIWYCAKSKQDNPKAYLFSAYLVGMELIIRMSGVSIPHEFIKYAVVVLLGLELVLHGKSMPLVVVLYVLLLIPSALLTNAQTAELTRQYLSANLSGHLCLIVSFFYFYNRHLTVEQLRKTFLSILYPLAGILGFLFIRTPDLSKIDFGYVSNFETSIYGPNQVSAILGLGILLIGVSFFVKIRLFTQITTLVFFGALAFRGLLTFSRGGMVSAVVTLALVFLFLTWKTAFQGTFFLRMVRVVLLISILAVTVFNYTNELTGNTLYERYSGRSATQNESLEKYTSGRSLIIYIDWQIFRDHLFLGVGPGMAYFYRDEYGYPFEVSAHNEFTRLLAEHGLFGVAVLLVLIALPAKRFFDRSLSTFEKALMIACIGFCFTFMFHSATRIAAPSFLYGLAFSRIFLPIRRRKKDTNVQPVEQVSSGMVPG